MVSNGREHGRSRAPRPGRWIKQLGTCQHVVVERAPSPSDEHATIVHERGRMVVSAHEHLTGRGPSTRCLRSDHRRGRGWGCRGRADVRRSHRKADADQEPRNEHRGAYGKRRDPVHPERPRLEHAGWGAREFRSAARAHRRRRWPAPPHAARKTAKDPHAQERIRLDSIPALRRSLVGTESPIPAVRTTGSSVQRLGTATISSVPGDRVKPLGRGQCGEKHTSRLRSRPTRRPSTPPATRTVPSVRRVRGGPRHARRAYGWAGGPRRIG